MAVRLSSAQAAQILAHAAERPDEEVCGLLFGSAEEIVAVQRTANVASDASRAFEIDPAALIAAHKAARVGGVPPVGCYHAHPNGVGEPSRRDRDAASPAMPVWLIVAGGQLYGWHWNGRAFEATPICLVTGHDPSGSPA